MRRFPIVFLTALFVSSAAAPMITTAQQAPAAEARPKTKAPIRVNLFNRAATDRKLDPSGRDRRPVDLFKGERLREAPAALSQEYAPDYTQGDITNDPNPADMQNEREDLLDPEWLKPVDALGDMKDEHLEQLGGSLIREIEEQRREMREQADEEEAMLEEREQIMRNLSGDEDPFDFLRTRGTLPEPERGAPDNSKRGGPAEQSVRATMGQNGNRAAMNLSERQTEKRNNRSPQPASSSSYNQSPARNAEAASSRSFVPSGSLIGGLLTGNRHRLSSLDSLNQKYSFSGKSETSAPEPTTRVRRAFVQSESGGVRWRSDLRASDTSSSSSSGYGSSFAGSRPNLRPGASSSSGMYGSQGGPSAGGGDSMALLRIGGGGTTNPSRSLSQPGRTTTSNTRSGFKPLTSGFDRDPFKNPGKF